MAALGSQSIASSYEQLLHVDRDGGGNSTTHVSVKDGDNGTTFGFTIASDALMMSSTNRLEFGDTGTYIHQSADGVLDLVSDTELELNATTIDINGAVEISGHTIIESTSQFRFGDSGTYIYQSADGVLDLVSDTEIEINATTIDMNGALDVSGNAQLSGTVTVGADGSGTDVIFYSGTAGDTLTWDASDEKLTITGSDGQTALDVADGNLVVADNALFGLFTAETDYAGKLQVEGTDAPTSSSSNFRNSNSSSGPYFTLGKSRGTSVGDDTIVQDNDFLGTINFNGADGSDRQAVGANIYARVNGDPGSNDMPTELVFGTAADGANAPTARMYIDSSGLVGIANDTPSDYDADGDDLVIGNSTGNRGLTVRSSSSG